MTNEAFDFGRLRTDSQIEWPKRGRTKKPLPEGLVNALHQSYTNGSTPNMVIPVDQKIRFTGLLAKAGKELNYRIEKLFDFEDVPEDHVRVWFKVKNLRHREAE